jgi:hypothetical protein
LIEFLPPAFILTVSVFREIVLRHVTLLHSDIQINSLVNPHDDLPADMQMFAQLLLDGKLFLQTVLVGPDKAPNSWELRLDCNMWVTSDLPPHS